MERRSLDVEMGFPVSGAPHPEGRIGPSRLPGGRAVVAILNDPDEVPDEQLQTEVYFPLREYRLDTPTKKPFR